MTPRQLKSTSGIFRLLHARSTTRPPFLATLATCGNDEAHARMVVIRGLDTKARTLWISTHRDAGKVKDLRANPDAECVVWFEEERIQMRLLAKWRVIDEAAAIRYKALTALRQKAWMSHSETSQQMFLWPAPGKVMRSPHKPSAPIAKGDDNPAPPPPAFTVLVGTLGRIDILQIEQGQHLRYLHAKTKGRWRSQRVTP